jgi:hypothetical protein
MFITLTPGVNIIKLFTMIIYPRSMVILSFCAKPCYHGYSHSMAFNYHCKSFITLTPGVKDIRLFIISK